MEMENMNVFAVEAKVCLGFTCFGASVTATGHANLELTDVELQALVDLINESSTADVEDMGLAEKLPEIYEKIDNVCLQAAMNAEESHWLEEGWRTLEIFDPADYIEYGEQELGYKFEYDPKDYTAEDGEFFEDELEDDKIENFYEWLTNYKDSLEEEARRDFMRKFINVELDDVEYQVEIPRDIIDKSNLG